ncbi:hypothetical protein [Reyranella sp.]|uniref:hypothetical protein n=1 Tax=Reyranella sp. TaxID=1929291 RepID=UPI003BAC6D49
MALAKATRDRLAAAGSARIAAALAQRGQRRAPSLAGLRPVSPVQDVLVGPASHSPTACPPGSVLVLAAPPVPGLALLARRQVAGLVCGAPLRTARELAQSGLPAFHRPAGAAPRPLAIDDGAVVVGDSAGLVVVPAALAEELAEEVAEAAAWEAFIAEQVDAGGGVYGLHIPSGEQGRRAFAAWRRLKGR